jgi:transcriptional regulator with XRE-family HTH domain
MKVLTDKQEMRNLAANLRIAMLERGWSQLDLERASGVRQPRISGILTVKHEPSVCVVSRLAKALSRSIDNLLSPPPQKKMRRAS